MESEPSEAEKPVEKPASKGRQSLITALKAIFGFGVAFLLLRMVLKQNNVDLPEELRNASAGLLVLGFCLFAATSLIGVARWKLLLDAQGVRLSWWELLRLSMIGIFFNLALPGAVSGDFLKMVYVSKHAGKRTAEAVLTIMLDRIFGLLGLLVIALASLIYCWDFVQSAPSLIKLSAQFVGFSSVVALVGVLCVQFHHTLQKLPGVNGLIGFGTRILPDKIVGIITRIVSAMDIYRNQKKVALFAILLSVCVHALFSCAVFSISNGVSAEKATLKMALLASPVANVAGSIPLAPAGLGQRDYVLAEYFKADGVAPEKAGAIPALLSVVIAAWSGVGMLFFVFARGETNTTEPEEVEGS